ncbi:A/G-specific adenine glycosylase [Microbacteriaceae bacterium]|nr:A/G-specific adenine glycosylase [Candidatus Saccharibacteria bacterium]
MTDAEFKEEVWARAHDLYRPMPWREDPSFYHVLVSELMLQQTQVDRVRTKFAEFMRVFPSLESLAKASLSEVLVVWQGLGYNRRAKYLHEAAKHIVLQGTPHTRDELVLLPGVGNNTAGALMNYVYEVPTAYVETNIRTVYFHHFFTDSQDISDKELLDIVERTIDHESPREWFYALMDYGTYLKKMGSGRLDVSKHYKKQSKLKGSVREIRGEIIRILAKGPLSKIALVERVAIDERFDKAFDGLVKDGLIVQKSRVVRLTNE